MSVSEWSCKSCSLKNSETSLVCVSCGTKRGETVQSDLDDNVVELNMDHDVVPPLSPVRTLQRQTSVSVESRRIRDERLAKDQLNQIVKFCKNVRKYK